jgi:serine/threonine protein kinase
MSTQQTPSRIFGGGEYREIRFLGQGGFAQVYLVEDNLGRRWALKQLHPDLIQHDPNILKRFEREARIQAGLEHPHIANVHAFNPQEGYLVIDYIEGRTLRKLIDDDFPDGMDFKTALQILQPLEEALTYIHEHAGFAHLDITPGNILIQETRTLLGRTEQHVVLADFGLARVIDSDGWADVTTLAGAPGYWAPEQCGMTLDKPGMRSDIYALGVVIGVMLTGRRPQEVLDLLRGTSNTLPSTLAQVKQVLQRATEEDPKKRYASVKGLIKVFKEAVAGPPVGGGSTVIPKPPRPVPNGRGGRLKNLFVNPVYSILATLLIVGEAVALGLVLIHPAPPPPHLTQLGGLDLGRYCKSLGYEGVSGELACSSPVNMNAACNWQWDRTDLQNQWSNPTDPLSATCYAGKVDIGGISDMAGYCSKRVVPYGAPIAHPSTLGTPAQWTCQQQINATLACIWQFSRMDVEARNDQGYWTCYSVS